MNASEVSAKLYFMCGKMAAAKSTFSRELARIHEAVLLNKDGSPSALCPGKILSIADYVRCSGRLHDALTPLVVNLLAPAYACSREARRLCSTIRATHANNVNDFANSPNTPTSPMNCISPTLTITPCKRQLKQRSAGLLAGSAWTTHA